MPTGRRPKNVLAVYAGFSAEEKQDAVATLASRKEYALDLLDAVEKKVVARTDISAFVARQLYRPGRQAGERIGCVKFGAKSATPRRTSRQQLKRYKTILTPAFLGRADLRNGRLVVQQDVPAMPHSSTAKAARSART